MTQLKYILPFLIAFIPMSSFAQQGFHAGTAIAEYGKVASIDSDIPLPTDTVFKVVFDVGKQADIGMLNRNMESVARFINMHTENGIAPENQHLAIVVHGGATKDLLKEEIYLKRLGSESGTGGLVRALLKQDVEIIVCGQSAVYHDVSKQDLIPGVKMGLSAMTTHALLQQQGYTLNPF
ncbi:MAG: DsrE family protein [bacterium]